MKIKLFFLPEYFAYVVVGKIGLNIDLLRRFLFPRNDAPGPSNLLARRVIDDLINFSGETSVSKYMIFFFLQQIAKTQRFLNLMRDEVQTARSCISQLTALIPELEAMGYQDEVFDTLICLMDDIRDENTKLMGLDDAIAEEDEKIAMKEEHVKIMEAASDDV
nr:hypothetical protein [Tanacetum cinerariifolium]